MSFEPERCFRSSIVGDLQLPEDRPNEGSDSVNPRQQVPMMIELNGNYPGGLSAVREAFYRLRERYIEVAGGWWPPELTSESPVRPPVPPGLALISPKVYQCVLTRTDLQDMVQTDHHDANNFPGLAGRHFATADRSFRPDRQSDRGLAIARCPRPRDRLGGRRQRDRRLPSALLVPGTRSLRPVCRLFTGADRIVAAAPSSPGSVALSARMAERKCSPIASVMPPVCPPPVAVRCHPCSCPVVGSPGLDFFADGCIPTAEPAT